MKDIIEKYGNIIKKFSDGSLVFKVNGYEMALEPFSSGKYLLTINLNYGIEEVIESKQDLDSFLKKISSAGLTI